MMESLETLKKITYKTFTSSFEPTLHYESSYLFR